MRNKKLTKSLTFVVAILLIVGGIGTTLAYLIDSDGPVTNIFTPSEITTKIEEKLGETKDDVRIVNTGDTPAYIKAAVVVTWKDAEGNVYGQKPVEGEHYEMTWWNSSVNDELPDDSWFEKGGYYYHKAAVAASNGETSVLFTDCKPKGSNTPDGYFLSVEIIGSGIQTGVDEAVRAWSDGKVSIDKDTGYLIVTEGGTN